MFFFQKFQKILMRPAGIHRRPGPMTDRPELVRDFKKFVVLVQSDPVPVFQILFVLVRSEGSFFDPGLGPGPNRLVRNQLALVPGPEMKIGKNRKRDDFR